MAKKKNSMALFEVISNIRDKNPDSVVVVPDWVKPGYQPPQALAPQETESQEPAPQEQAPQEPTPHEPAAPKSTTHAPAQDQVEAPEAPSRPAVPTTSTWEPRKTDAPRASEARDLPIWSTDGGRLTLSLNYVSCMVASIGILLLVSVAFVIGRVTASPETTPTKPGNTVIKREAGKFYMVVQTLPGGNTEATRREAKQMADFCTKNGEPAEVKLLQGNLIVWSARPFNLPTGEEVSGHALSLQNELGPKYAKQYGSKYKFAQPQKNGRLAPLMFPYKEPKSR